MPGQCLSHADVPQSLLKPSRQPHGIFPSALKSVGSNITDRENAGKALVCAAQLVTRERPSPLLGIRSSSP